MCTFDYANDGCMSGVQSPMELLSDYGDLMDFRGLLQLLYNSGSVDGVALGSGFVTEGVPFPVH